MNFGKGQLTKKTQNEKIQDEDVLTLYLRDLNNLPPLSREAEDEVARKAAAGDDAARNKLVQSNLRFVVNIAKRYQGKGMHLADLIAEGNYGLICAAERFDPDKGYHFISYAVWWVKQAILKAIYDKSRAIRLPVNRVCELVKIEKISKDLNYKLSIDERMKQIAAHLNMDVDDVQMLLKVSRDLVSLDMPVYYEDNDSPTIGEGLSDDQSLAPDEDAMQRILHEDIESALHELNENEESVIRFRYGIGERTQMSFRELGGFLGITKERVRQIEKKALKRLASDPGSRRLRSYTA